MTGDELYDTYVIALDAFSMDHPRPVDAGSEVFMDWLEDRTKAALSVVVKADRGELVAA
jgi:hypothetical protein